VDEFWVCQHCKSLNRAGTVRCYSCRNKLGSKAPEVETLRGAAPPPAPAPLGASPGASRAPVAFTSYARPALGPAGLAASPAALAPRGPSGLTHPIAAIRRRMALYLATHPSVSVSLLGYVSAALVALVLLFATFATLTALPFALDLLRNADPGPAWNGLTAGQRGLLEALSIASAAAALLALLCFSVFVGLTTHNATGLGAGQTLLSPYRAGTCWAGVLWTQVRLAVGLLVPAAIIWRGYALLGLIAALVAVEIAHRHLDDPDGWMLRPARHLPDLYASLATPAPTPSPLASLWSASFRIANVLAVLLSALPLIGAFVYGGSGLVGKTELIGWQAGAIGPAQIVVAVVAVGLAGWTWISLALLVPLAIGLVRRQRTRSTLARVGRSRSWVARPGEGHYAAGPANPVTVYGEPADDDRIVERRPGFGTPGGPGFGGPAGPEYGEPGGPGQASLYSPSTTSSFPWSDEPPSGPG
jgi:hypothetical protein